jgi:hypothetical protein
MKLFEQPTFAGSDKISDVEISLEMNAVAFLCVSLN